jgi:2-polyprenyl-3-methyl-5-hydroxy-6-metoxy-1,4-benzoquinol methylase
MKSPSRASVIEEYTTGDVLDVGVVQHDIEKTSNETWLHEKIYDFDGVNEVVGIDMLDEEIEILQEKGYNVQTQNAEKIDFDRKFDTIVAGELIEHLSNPGKFLEKSSQHLRSGGSLIITTPNTFNILRFLYLIKNDEVPCNPEHTGWYDPKTLNQLVQRYDLDNKKMDTFSFEDELEYTDPISRILRTVFPQAWTAETIVAIFEKN